MLTIYKQDNLQINDSTSKLAANQMHEVT